MQSKPQRYTFYATSILSIMLLGVGCIRLARMLDLPNMYSGPSLPVALFLVAWIYPLKTFDDDGVLGGMHREALKVSGFFIFTSICMPLEASWGIDLPEWGSMLLFVGVLVVSIVLYNVMLNFLSRRTSKTKKIVEQDVAPNL